MPRPCGGLSFPATTQDDSAVSATLHAGPWMHGAGWPAHTPCVGALPVQRWRALQACVCRREYQRSDAINGELRVVVLEDAMLRQFSPTSMTLERQSRLRWIS